MFSMKSFKKSHTTKLDLLTYTYKLYSFIIQVVCPVFRFYISSLENSPCLLCLKLLNLLLGKCQNKSATLQPSRSAALCLNASVSLSPRKCPDKNAALSPAKSARMCRNKSAAAFLVKSAKLSPKRNANRFWGSIATTCRSKSARMCQSKSAGLFPTRSAILCPDKNASGMIFKKSVLYESHSLSSLPLKYFFGCRTKQEN